jgi:fluoroacetyl-CoA thioesterase
MTTPTDQKPGDLKPGLRHSATIRVTDALAVPASGHLLGASVEMPPVFATAQMIAFVEWTCVAALAPCLAPHQRTVGTRVEMTHTAATPIGMQVAAEIELIEIDGRRLRFKVSCRDEFEPIGDGFHERTIIDHDRFMARLARKRPMPR